jgi:hypothetical protein
VWRGAGARSHAPGPTTSATSNERDHSYEPNNADQLHETNELDDPNNCGDANNPCRPGDPDKSRKSYDSGGSGQYTLTASCMKWSA